MIRLPARAKINIGLKILDKRPDGYHSIETIYATISLSDTVALEDRDGSVDISCPGVDVPLEENLVYRAAQLVRERFSVTRGCRITVDKKIPVGGGLAGGSADAAAALRGLNDLWRLNLSTDEMMKLGAVLGCDVPFLIRGGAAYARGKGDELKFFNLPHMELIVYYPGYPVSTAWAYQAYDKKVLTPAHELDMISGKNKKPLRTGVMVGNDFEPVVFQRYPDLLDVKANLLATGASLVSLSGSGSCLYAVVDESSRKKAVKYLSGISAVYFEAVTV
jgi:4-diphosphocytidyl-2-C-methyl-D-erythritol kinase